MVLVKNIHTTMVLGTAELSLLHQLWMLPWMLCQYRSSSNPNTAARHFLEQQQVDKNLSGPLTLPSTSQMLYNHSTHSLPCRFCIPSVSWPNRCSGQPCVPRIITNYLPQRAKGIPYPLPTDLLTVVAGNPVSSKTSATKYNPILSINWPAKRFSMEPCIPTTFTKSSDTEDRGDLLSTQSSTNWPTTETSENPVPTLLLPTGGGYGSGNPISLKLYQVTCPRRQWESLQNVPPDSHRGQWEPCIPTKRTNWPATGGSGNPVYLQNVQTDLPQGQWESLQNVPTDQPQRAMATRYTFKMYQLTCHRGQWEPCIPSKCTNWPATGGSGTPVYLQNVQTDLPPLWGSGNPVSLQNVPTDLPQGAVGILYPFKMYWPATEGNGKPVYLQNVPTDQPQGAIGTLPSKCINWPATGGSGNPVVWLWARTPELNQSGSCARPRSMACTLFCSWGRIPGTCPTERLQ